MEESQKTLGGRCPTADAKQHTNVSDFQGFDQRKVDLNTCKERYRCSVDAWYDDSGFKGIVGE